MQDCIHVLVGMNWDMDPPQLQSSLLNVSIYAVTRKESAKLLLTSLLRESGQYPRAFPVGGTLVAMLVSLGERVGAERKSKILNLT